MNVTDDALRDRLSRLLALARGTQYEGERESATLALNRLLEKHGLTLADAPEERDATRELRRRAAARARRRRRGGVPAGALARSGASVRHHPECSSILYRRPCDCYRAPGWSTLKTLPGGREA